MSAPTAIFSVSFSSQRLWTFYLLISTLSCFHPVWSCPSNCSGHGSCETGAVCSCFSGWDYAVDCSLRTCPDGPAWSDKAYAADVAHSASECSGAGRCNRGTGICHCFDGYEGAACQRSSCPNNCSGNGVCMTLADAGVHFGTDYDQAISNGGDGIGPIYSNWDADSIGICVCDWGMLGPDCSLRMCPKADDPVTIDQSNRRVLLHVASDGTAFSGSVKVQFNGHVTEIDLSNALVSTDAYCKEKFEDLENVGSVQCTVTTGSDTDNSWATSGAYLKYDLTFLSWPSRPFENNLFSHTGNPDITSFSCDISEVSIAGGTNSECILSDIVNTGIKEYEFCGRRGSCNFLTGLCTCFENYSGHDCTELVYLMFGANADPALAATATGTDYTGSILELQSERASNTVFDFMSCKADGNELFRIDGIGDIEGSGLVLTTNGATIKSGGLSIDSGGCSIVDGNLNMASSDAIQNTLQVTSSSSSFSKASVAAYSSNTASKTSFNLLEAGESSSNLVFSVRGDGKTTVGGGGLDVSGGATVANGATINGGLHVPDDALLVETVTSTLDTVLTAHAKNNNHNGVVLLAATDAASGSNTEEVLKVVINANADEMESAATVMRVTAEPKTEIVSGGLLVSSGGVAVTSGGATISSGGLLVSAGTTTTAGLTASGLLQGSSGLVVQGGVTTLVGLTAAGLVTASNGISVSGTATSASLTASGLITGSAGLVISAGTSTFAGLSSSGAIKSTAGLSVSGGVATTGAITAAGLVSANTGLVVSGVATVAGLSSSAVMKSTAGMTISGAVSTTAALTASGLITATNGISASGLVVSTGTTTTAALTASGLVTGSSGLVVSGGVSTVAGLTSSGLVKSSAGMVVSGTLSTAAVSASGLLKGTSGLSVSGAVSTIASGLSVSGTLTTASISTSGLLESAAGLVVQGGVSTVAGLTSSSLIKGTSGLTVSGGTTSTAALSASGLLSAISGMVVSGAVATVGSGLAVTGTTTTSSITASGLIGGSSGLVVAGGVSTVAGLTSGGVLKGISGLIISGATSTVADITASGLVTNNAGLVVANSLTTVAGLTSSSVIKSTSGMIISGSTTTTASLTSTGNLKGTAGLFVSGGVATVVGLTSSSLVKSTAGLFVSGGVTTTAALTSSGTITGTNGISISGAVATVSSGLSVTGVATTAAITASGLVTGSSGLVVSGGVSTVAAINSNLITSTGMASSGAVTATSFDNTSDLRFKKKVKSIGDALDIVKQLNGVKYVWRKEEYPDRSFDSRTHLGFIAQEVEKILPDLVGTDDDGWKSIRSTQIIAVLVEAIKELHVAQQVSLDESKRSHQSLEDMKSDIVFLKEAISLC